MVVYKHQCVRETIVLAPEDIPATSKNPPIPIQQSLVLLMACVGLATLADWLFRANLLGLNLSLLVSSFSLVLFLYSSYQQDRWQDKPNLFLLTAWVLLSWLFLWRASPFLQVLNVGVQLLLLLLLVARLSMKALRESNVAEILINTVGTGFSLLFRPFVFLFETKWPDLSHYQNQQSTKTLFAVLRGLLIALPLLLVFGFLLASADAVFERLLSKVFRFNLESLVNHLVVIILLSMVMLALLVQALFGPAWKSFQIDPPQMFRLGRIETSLIFGLLIALFLGFMMIQFGYLFGGEARVLSTEMTYAQYGRRGFFELVTVTFLLHLILLLGLWFITEQKARNLYKMLATVLVVLLFGIIWSAQRRLGLYIETYGLTELRYYSSAMIYWIGVVMMYFLFRLHSNYAPKLAPSYLVFGLLGVLALYISNPDTRIAQVNLERAKVSNKVDTEYLSQLSLDAVPVLVNFETTQGVKAILESKYYNLPTSDWRHFNYGRWRGAERLKAMFQISL